MAPKNIKKYFNAEIEAYQDNVLKGNFSAAWRHLERAHIIGQSYPYQHSKAHWEMLKFGFKIKNTHEIIGQLPRLLVGGVKSFVGKVPLGNTGGADVSPLKPMDIPADIQLILNESR